MKTRSSFEICLPLVVFGVACLASLPTLILSLLWLTLGACSVGHRSLEEFPADGIPRHWLRGPCSVILWLYHLAWWPWYMRSELQQLGGSIANALNKMRHHGRNGTTDTSSKRRTHDEEG